MERKNKWHNFRQKPPVEAKISANERPYIVCTSTVRYFQRLCLSRNPLKVIKVLATMYNSPLDSQQSRTCH